MALPERETGAVHAGNPEDWAVEYVFLPERAECRDGDAVAARGYQPAALPGLFNNVL